MVKGNKDPIPNISSVQNREIIQRLNFLYQASVYLQSIAPTSSRLHAPDSEADELEDKMCAGPSPANEPTKGVQRQRKRKRVANKTTADLARSYVQCMHVVGQKTTVKMYATTRLRFVSI